MTNKTNYTEKLLKIVKKRKTEIIIQKQGKSKVGYRKSLRSLTHESYSYDDYYN